MLLALTVLSLPRHTTAQLKPAIGGFFFPLFGLANSAHSLVERAGNIFAPRRGLIQQLNQLRQDNQALRLCAMQWDEARRENNRLRELLGMQRQSPWTLKIGRVVGRDPANWWRTIHIDLGYRDGIRPNLTVLTADGLVGRTSNVSFSRSQVVLVGDPNCYVAALIQETRDTTGIIVPSPANLLDNSIVNLTYLPGNSIVQPSQKVTTSGQGGIFPKGIPIGEVIDARNVEFGLYMEARVKLAVNFNRLEEVWVLFP